MPHAQARFAVEATPAAVHRARRRIAATVRSWAGPYDDDLPFRVGLVASELLTNGLRHATGPLTVEVSLEGAFTVLQVHDASPVLPEPRVARADEERGRGLVLVDSLCLLRGAERTAHGKRCWAVLAVAAASGPAAGETPDSAGDDGGGPSGSGGWALTPAGEALLSSLSPAASRPGTR